jgi:branched-chain amino acid transport system permease protein
VTTVLVGLATGAIYAVVALGYNIVFVSSGVLNFAFAQLLILGTFLAYLGAVTLKLPFFAVFGLAAIIVGVVAIAEERTAVRVVRTSEALLVTTVGFATLVGGLSQVIWGSNPLQVPFFGPTRVWTVLDGRIFPVQLLLLVVAVVLTIVFVLFSRHTMIGLAMLAVSEDREAALMRGINVQAYAIGAFAVSGVIAGLLGPLVGPITFANATQGSALALEGFVAVAIGGFGSAIGALIGGFSVGLIEAFSGQYLGTNYSDLMVFTALLIVLLLKPTGLFGTPRERMV